MIADFTANWKVIDQRARLGRMFDHKKMLVKLKSEPNVGETEADKDLKRVIEAFAQLQEDRHTADYDVAVIWSRVDVMFSLTTAEQAFAAWKRIRNEKVARDHLLTMFGARRG